MIMKTTRILLATSLALMALVGCTKFEPEFQNGRWPNSGGNAGGNGGNGGNGGSGGSGGQQTATPTLQNGWKIEYKGRSVFTEDGSNDTVEGFAFTYSGSAYYIVRMVSKGSVLDKDLATFFTDEAKALDDKFAEDENNVFKDSRTVYFDLLLHGEYDVYMIEISDKKKATMSYQKAVIEVKEDEASSDYLSWLGFWRVSTGLIGYDIEIQHAENNLLYYVWGWESGPAAMTQDMGDDWLFVRYDPSTKGLAFYVQTIGEDNDEDGSRFDKVFVGTWPTPDGDVVDDLEGSVIARSGENEKGELALIPETIVYDNDAVFTYKTMRYSSYSYKDELWYHYNASVPPLYTMVNKVMTYPLTMEKIANAGAPMRVMARPQNSTGRIKAKVHGSAQRRPVK